MTSRDDASFVWELPGETPAVPRAQPAGATAPATPATPAEQTLTVTQVAAVVKGALARGFPQPVWVVGETVQVKPHPSGHLYFDLVDHEAGEGARATLKLKMWAQTVRQLLGPRGRLRGFKLDSSLVVRVRVRPDFWAQGGQLSFIVEDIDPDYTVGRLERERRELLERLSADGTDRWNKERPLPAVPLVLGLVTSADSAAYADVLRTLRDGGVGFRIVCCDARMQGEDASRTVRAALLAVAARKPDCILLVRGGGSRIDLSWFDREDIARAVATCPVPVLTGIGHEIDTSVADFVAHRSFKTPTAVAEFLVATAREACRELEDRHARIVAGAQESLADERQSLLDVARALRVSAAGAVQAQTSALREASQSLRAACEAGLFGAADALTALRERLLAAARAGLERGASRLDLAEQRARLLDPQAVLKRGYAWLRRADGSLLKDAGAAVAGETLTGVLRDGELALRALPHPTGGT